MHAFAPAALDDPGRQSTHADRSASGYLFAGHESPGHAAAAFDEQSTHAVAPTPLERPGAHGVHFGAVPAMPTFEYCPAAQNSHVLPPAEGCEPGGHTKQNPEPASDTDPGAHGVQLVALNSEKAPAGHVSHEDDPVEGAYVPARHS